MIKWLFFALMAAITQALYFFVVKKYTTKVDYFILGSGPFLFGGVFLLIISLFEGIPTIGPNFYSAMFITVLLNFVAALLYFKALKNTDLSLAIPMIAFTPLFLVFTSLIILNEAPTIFGLIGIISIVIGSYVLNMKNGHGFFDPFRQIVKNKGVFMMLLVGIIWSFTINFDKITIQSTSPLFSGAILHIGIGLLFLLLSFKKVVSNIKNNYAVIFWPGIFLGVSYWFFAIGLSLEIASYVTAIKRTAVLMSVFLGGYFFKEKHFLKRLIGASIMLAGIALIVLY